VGIGEPPPRSDAIVVADLAKRFDANDAIAGISFSVQRGELFGFLDPNSAGKSTIVNLLTGLACPDAGSIRLGGIDCTHRPRESRGGPASDRRRTGREQALSRRVRESCLLRGALRTAKCETRARELLDSIGLGGAAAPIIVVSFSRRDADQWPSWP